EMSWRPRCARVLPMMLDGSVANTSTRSPPMRPKPQRRAPRSSRFSTRCSSRRSGRRSILRSKVKGQKSKVRSKAHKADEGYEGWDDYAPFYDWENARTLGKRDVPFWRNLALHCGGPVLELGCGTGRISLPLGRAGVPLVGIDRSTPMLVRARTRVRGPRA